MKHQQLLAWAHMTIRELDELCRSQIPDYEVMDSSEMDRLHALKALAADAEATPYPDLRDEVKNLRAENQKLHSQLANITAILGPMGPTD